MQRVVQTDLHQRIVQRETAALGVNAGAIPGAFV
jgi:hypothetical protein